MEITANDVQQVVAGNNVIFTDTPVPGNCSIMHREGSGLIKLRGLTSTQCRARFKATFGANLAIPTGGLSGPVSLVFALDGEPVPATFMIVTPGNPNRFYNVATSIYIDVPAGCCSTLAVKNANGPAVDVANANLIVERVA